jgi:hypothetical protein
MKQLLHIFSCLTMIIVVALGNYINELEAKFEMRLNFSRVTGLDTNSNINIQFYLNSNEQKKRNIFCSKHNIFKIIFESIT